MGTKNNPGKFDYYNAAEPDEPMFVLLGRDPIAPILVGFWVALREHMGDIRAEKHKEALACGKAMVQYLKNDKLSKKWGRTRHDLFEQALGAVRSEFFETCLRVVTRELVQDDVVRAHYREVDCIIANNTGIVKRAEDMARGLREAKHTYESARAQIVKRVHEDIVLVYLEGLDRVYRG